MRQLRHANKILRKGEPLPALAQDNGGRVFCSGGTRPPVQTMTAFTDEHGAAHGGGVICKVLQVARSGYYARLAVRADPLKRFRFNLLFLRAFYS